MTVVAGVSLGVWVYLLLGRGQFWRMRPDRLPNGGVEPAPSVTAVVPARNEAAVVARSIESLAAQRYSGDFDIVLVDDDSDDGTAEAARAAASGIRIVPARPLPQGWTGKMWAVSQGVAQASGEYILLTDADIVHPPEHVAGLVTRAREGSYDMVSYMVRLSCRTVAEQALIPAFVFFFFQLYPPAWIRDARRGTAGAAGGCILIRRSMLESIGGIARIGGELIDDCALARAVKQAGGRVWLGLSGTAHSIREYATFAEIGGMVARTAYTQLKYSPLLLAGTIVGLILTYLVPPVLTLFAPVGAARGLSALAWLLMTLAYLPSIRYVGRPWYCAPLLPAIAAFYLAATLYSAFAHWRGRGGVWKGRAH